MLTSSVGATAPETFFAALCCALRVASNGPNEDRREKEGRGGGLVVPLRPQRQRPPNRLPTAPVDPDHDDDPPPRAA